MGLLASEAIRTEQQAFTIVPGSNDGEIVPFGIYHVDQNLIAGVKPTSPQLNVIQGGGGARKTSLMLNFIINMCLSGKLSEGHLIVYDTLESGMTIERIILVLRCMVATKYMLYRRILGIKAPHPDDDILCYLNKLFDRSLPPVSPEELLSQVTFVFNNQEIPELAFKPDLIELFYKDKINLTANQLEAWLIAGDAVSLFPLEVYGISEHNNDDVATARSIDTTDHVASFERWLKLADEYSSIQVISDYMQSYWTGSSDHYEKQKVIVPYYERFVKSSRSTLWVISQEGIGHQRDFNRSGEVLGSSGGDVLKNASQNNWRVSYSKVNEPCKMILHAPVKSRRGNHPDLELMIEPNSGVIFGRSRIKGRE